MRTWLLRRARVDMLMLFNAGSLAGTTAVTSVLGFVYWWIAARKFSPEAVGFASAAISAMLLLGTACVLGLGTLLIGELPRQKGQEAALISGALILVGVVGGIAGIGFAIASPLVSSDFNLLSANLSTIAMFALGVSLTSVTIVLDQAFIGLLRGDVQFWRNTFFAVAKFILVYWVSFWLLHDTGMAIYAAWTVSNALSLLALAVYYLLRGRLFGTHYLPQWGMLRKLGPEALRHHVLNLTLQAPTLILPVLVTVLLSVITNAWFYVAWRVAGFVFVVPTVLPTALYAASAAQPAALASKIRLTLGLATAACLLASCLLLLGTQQVLSLFGSAYADQATWCLRILCLGAFPLIIKNHYIAICRIKNQVGRATLPMIGAGVFELGVAALGARLDGLSGLSLGWVLALCLEALLMARTVYIATFPSITPVATLLVDVPLSIIGEQANDEETGCPPGASLPDITGDDEDLEAITTRLNKEVAREESVSEEESDVTIKLDRPVAASAGLKGADDADTTVKLDKSPASANLASQDDSGKTAVAVVAREPSEREMPVAEEETTVAVATRKPVETLDKSTDITDEPRSRLPVIREFTWLLLPAGAFALWLISLRSIDLGHMNELGLVSVFPPATIVALAILLVSFCLALHQPKLRTPVLALHILLLIFMLYGVTALIEAEPRFSVVYRHAGYTEFIMRTGTVDTNLDAYFSWPGFFVLSAFVTRITGLPSILSIAAWAPVFYNLIYLLPLYNIFTSATLNKRLVWLGLCFFYLTNWIGQDYYSPQGLNLFLYLVVIAILVKWFKAPPAVKVRVKKLKILSRDRFRRAVSRFFIWLTAPDALQTPAQPRQRAALLVSLILIFFFSVFSHPLTPFFILSSVMALVIFRRCGPLWLPILLGIMTAAWTIFMAQNFLAGHLSWVTGGIGQLSGNVTVSLTNRVIEGDPQHIFIAAMRVVMTGGIWLFACAGGLRRLRKGYNDATYIILALAPFPVLVAQSYGGEVLLRIYFFSLPLMVFFAAALFYPEEPVSWQAVSEAKTESKYRRTRGKVLAIIAASMFLLGGFLFTRYGNENMDYMTRDEVAGVHALYSIARPGSIFIEGWDGTPWQFQDYEKYNTYSLIDHPEVVMNSDVSALVQFIQHTRHTNAYLIFTRSQKATVQGTSNMPPGTLDKLEVAMLASGKFKLEYRNTDAQIFLYTGDTGGAKK